MAKKKATPAEIQAQENLIRIEKYVSTVDLIYNDFIEELTKLAARLPGGIKSVKAFSFDNYPSIRGRLDKLIKDTSVKAINAINLGIKDGIERANLKNDALIDRVFKIGSKNMTPEKALKYKAKLGTFYDRNLTAAATRETKSLLSKNVYNITKQFTKLAEIGLDVGIAQGKPARMLASEIRKAVNDPTPLFRRVAVIDKDGKKTLKLSKAAIKYRQENPAGTGKYYNPVRNYQRLTRTEINMAYRTADHVRNEKMDFIVGIRINLSTNPNHCPFCIRMAGDYPKTFLFRGWHPQCRCYRTTILKTAEELEKDSIRIIQGKEPLTKSVNQVKKAPKEFYAWVKENTDRIINAEKTGGSIPYWIQDNFKDGKINAGLTPGKIVGGLQ